MWSADSGAAIDTATADENTTPLGNYLQSQDRIHRKSQTRGCEIVLLLSKDSVDSLIDFVLEQKYRAAKFMQSGAPHLASDGAQMIRPEDLHELVGAL